MAAAVIATAVAGAVLPGGWGYVGAAYLVTVVALVAYALWVIVRGRKVGRRLAPEDRRWM